MLAVGLALTACAPPETSSEGSGNEQRAEKPTKEQPKDEQPAKEQPKDDAGDKNKERPKEPAPKEPGRKPKPEPNPSAPTAGRQYDATVTVSRVVDGDTIEISPAVAGNEEVRLIGVDTPETEDPNEEIEPMGPEASAYAESRLTGARVELEFDVERFDQYGRLLAYVYAGGQMFNEDLVEEGYAQAYPYEPNTRYADRFAAAQEQAKASGLGIWGLTLAQQCQLADRGNGIGEGSPGCSSVSASASASATASAEASASAGSSATASPAAGGQAVPPISEDDCPLNARIKGNASSGIYHVPGGAYYDETDPEECFATPRDAEAAGYRASEV